MSDTEENAANKKFEMMTTIYGVYSGGRVFLRPRRRDLHFPLIFLIVPPLGVLGIQICSPIANFLSFILALPIGIWTLRKDLASRPFPLAPPRKK